MTISVVVFMTALLTGCGGGASGSSSGIVANDSLNASVVGKSASLSWNAPATRVNGEGLRMGELQGYVILYGKQSDDLSRRIEINSANTMDYTVANLDQGEWFFAIQVIDDNGLMSAPSEVVSKTI